MFQDDGNDATKIVVAWIGFLGAVIAAIVAVANSIFAYTMNRRSQARVEEHQRQMQQLQTDLTKEVEAYKAGLSEKSAKKKARRDYEYEARKRLYQQCEPLLFELYLLSIGGMKRVHSLARTARQGNLAPGTSGWLSVDQYYALSTVYKLFAPLVVVKILQRRLTLVDFNLDRRIREQFALADALYLTFTSDFKLAEIEPEIPYNPNRQLSMEGALFEEKLKKKPTKYYRQGLTVGSLDSAVEAMIVTGVEKDTVRCMSYGEFETEYENPTSKLHRKFSDVMKLFLNFHPQTRPVLWRILITQLYLYETIVLNSETNFTEKSADWPFGLLDAEEQGRYDWRCKGDGVDEHTVWEPFKVAEQYLRKMEEKRSRRATENRKSGNDSK
jgi:hypothetical protein